jgi:hypothetical protein
MTGVTDATDDDRAGGLRSTVAREAREYTGGENRPLGSFVAIMGAYAGAVGLGAVAVRRRGLPERPRWDDLLLVAVATHKLSRLVAKDPVTSPLRAPFTRFRGTSGEAELSEEVRGSGPRKAVGELVTCPFCVGQWVATALMFGLALAPRATRFTAALLASLTAADFLQFAYAAAEQRSQR